MNIDWKMVIALVLGTLISTVLVSALRDNGIIGKSSDSFDSSYSF